MRVLTLIFLCLLATVHSFVAIVCNAGLKSFSRRSQSIRFLSSSGNDGDGLFNRFIDGLSKTVANSPLNNGKKALAKMIAGDYDEQAVQAKIDGLIKDNDVLMLSFTTCPFCLKAKSVLNEKGIEYKTVELDKEPDGMQMRSQMSQMIGRTSVPAIWIKGTFVGGCNDGPMGGIVKLNQSGELDAMLQ